MGNVLEFVFILLGVGLGLALAGLVMFMTFGLWAIGLYHAMGWFLA